MMQRFLINGNKPLKGAVYVIGSKNTALPILCAALLTEEVSTFENVPDIADIRSLIKIIQSLGVEVKQENGKVTIHPKHLKKKEPLKKLVQKMRASALLAAPLLARNKVVKMEFPGGCVLGKRPLHAHTYVFQKFGATILEDQKALHATLKNRKAPLIVMPEASVTATENALMLAAVTPGTTDIRLAACEPHVQDLCHVLIKMGAKISGIGGHNLIVQGAKKLKGVHHKIMGDYLEVGTFAIAAAVTKGDVVVKGFPMHHLDSFWQKFEEAQIPYDIDGDSVRVYGVKKIQPIPSLKTAIHPSFPTDLQAPFTVLLTQAQGVSKVFETLFDGRLSYLFELEKMGARMEILNQHQAIIIGPARLKGTEISSCDIRAGAGMVLAALAAEGQSIVTNISYIDRGYEKFEEKLKSLGADIHRID